MNPRTGVLVVAALAGCAQAPPPSDVDLELTIPDEWQAGESADGGVPLRWWETFAADDLDTVVQEALVHNRDLQATAARLEAVTAQAVIAGADVYPAVSAGLDAGRRRQNFIGLPIPGSGGQVLSTTTTSWGVNLNLSWELDLWGRIRSGQSAALADVEAAQADLGAAQLSIVAQVCKAYFSVVEARLQRELAEATVSSFRATADDVEQRYQRGVRPALDTRLASSNLSAAEANLELRLEQLERTQRQLELLLGRYPEGGAWSDAGLPEDYPEVPAGLPSELLQRRPDLIAAERRLAATDARLDQAHAALYPRISLTTGGGAASADVEDLIDSSFRVWGLAGNLLQPLFQGGALLADIDRNAAFVREAVAIYAQSVLRAFTEVESALASEEHLAQREAFLVQASDHTLAALQLAQGRYDRGLIDFLTVADTQRSAFNARSALITARRQRLDNRIDLYLALGGGFAPETPEANP